MSMVFLKKSEIKEFEAGPEDFKFYSWYSPRIYSFYLAFGTRLFESLLIFGSQNEGFISNTLRGISKIFNLVRVFANRRGFASELGEFMVFLNEFNLIRKSSNISQFSKILENSDDKCRTLKAGIKFFLCVLCPDVTREILNEEPLPWDTYMRFLRELSKALSININLFHLPEERMIEIIDREEQSRVVLHLVLLLDESDTEEAEESKKSKKFKKSQRSDLRRELDRYSKDFPPILQFGTLYSSHCREILKGNNNRRRNIPRLQSNFPLGIKSHPECAKCKNSTEISISCPNHSVCNVCRSRAVVLGFKTCDFKQCGRNYTRSEYKELYKQAAQTYGQSMLPVGRYTCILCEETLPHFTSHNCGLDVCSKCCRKYGYPCKYSEVKPLEHVSDYQCTICLNTLDQPYTTPCGHHFCRRCAAEWFYKSSKCPHDNQSIEIQDLKYNADVNNTVHELREKASIENSLIEILSWKALNKKGSYYYLITHLERYLEKLTHSSSSLRRLEKVCDWANKLVNTECTHDAPKIECSCTFEHCLRCLKIMARHANRNQLPLLCFCGIDLSRRTKKKLKKMDII